MPTPIDSKIRTAVEAEIRAGSKLKDLAAKYKGKVSLASINNWSSELRKSGSSNKAGKSVSSLLKLLREAITAEVKEELKARLG